MSEATYRSNARLLLEGDDCFQMEQQYDESAAELLLSFLPEKEAEENEGEEDEDDDEVRRAPCATSPPLHPNARAMLATLLARAPFLTLPQERIVYDPRASVRSHASRPVCR